MKVRRKKDSILVNTLAVILARWGGACTKGRSLCQGAEPAARQRYPAVGSPGFLPIPLGSEAPLRGQNPNPDIWVTDFVFYLGPLHAACKLLQLQSCSQTEFDQTVRDFTVCTSLLEFSRRRQTPVWYSSCRRQLYLALLQRREIYEHCFLFYYFL